MFVTKIQHFAKKGPFFAQLADDEYGGDGDHEEERALYLDGAQLTDDEGGEDYEEERAPP